ncbi:MAG: FAD-dependent oxidoreductase [Acidobacteria bacterium]|nr:FAD-dependent oxidoreductase [Acidobacteriota bacterium]
MRRRTFLTTGSMVALGAGFAACAPNPKPGLTPLRPRVNLAPVDASWDRIIRTTVGLRPHRDAGFVLKADKLDDKLLVHNYGHGGAGMSISWGTGLMAAEFASQQPGRRAAVIGSGAVGLTTARQLQRRGFDVTIYALAVPPNVTSNMSLAGFTPYSGLVVEDRRTPEWDAQFTRAAAIAYRQLQLLTGESPYGVSWVDSYQPTDELPRPPQSAPPRPNLQAGLIIGPEILQPGEHPFPTKYAIRRAGIRIEPSIYLDALVRDVLMFGGRIVMKKFDTARDLMALAEPVVVNCSGLGARDLFGDQELVPLKGQLTVMVPQPEVNYQTNGGVRDEQLPPGSLGLHMMPRSDGIILGGTSERGVTTMEPNEAERKRVVDGHIELFTAMRARGRAGVRT